MPGSHSSEESSNHINSPSQASCSYNPTDCTFSCDACTSLAQLDDEILRLRLRVAELSNQRQYRLSSINSNKPHDASACLPVEILSDIFKLCCMDTVPMRSMVPLLVVGAVCRRWRNVTIKNPRLWSTIIISADTNCNLHRDVLAVGQWLSRSVSLPISLCVTLKNTPAWSTTRPPHNNLLSPLIKELRRHSKRWKSVTFNKMSNQYLLLDLFKDVETDFEVIISNWDPVAHPRDLHEHGLFHPKSLRVEEGTTIKGLAFGWERLTSLTVSKELYVNELFNIIRNAPKLLFCSRRMGGLASAASPDGLSLVEHSSLTCLHTGSSMLGWQNLLRFVKLPSLKTLHYEYHCRTGFDRDFGILDNFFDRSELQCMKEFVFVIKPKDSWSSYITWYHGRVPITSLGLDTSGISSATLESIQRKVNITKNFFSLLAGDIRKGLLPELRQLVFNVTITSDFWRAFFNLLWPETEQTLCNWNDSEATRRTPLAPNLLKAVHISLPEEWNKDTASKMGIDASVLAHLAEIETTGVNIIFRHGSSEYSFSTAFNVLS